jgi:hypothetical protein
MEVRELPVEVRLIICDMFSAWYKDGVCSVNQKRVEHWLGSKGRKNLADFLAYLEVTGMMQRVAGHSPSNRSIQRVFKIEGFNSKNPVFSLANSSAYLPCSCSPEWRSLTFKSETLKNQEDCWWEWCLLTKNKLLFDARGLTEWCKAVHAGIRSLVLPQDVSRIDSRDMSLDRVKWLEGYVSRVCEGLSPIVAWKRNRLFHALSGCPRKLRELGVFQYGGTSERGVTVDIHAMYWCALASMLPDSDEKTRLIELLSTRGFYSKLAADTGAENNGEFKKQVNMQCLFYKSHWPASCRPVWLALEASFPQLCSLIISLRRKHGVGGLSDLLMSVESKIVALGALVEASKLCPCIPLHDCLFVPESKADQIREIIVKHAASALGFAPQVRIA